MAQPNYTRIAEALRKALSNPPRYATAWFCTRDGNKDIGGYGTIIMTPNENARQGCVWMATQPHATAANLLVSCQDDMLPEVMRWWYRFLAHERDEQFSDYIRFTIVEIDGAWTLRDFQGNETVNW